MEECRHHLRQVRIVNGLKFRILPILTGLIASSMFGQATIAFADNKDHVDTLLAQLNSPDWAVRDRATFGLLNQDPSILDRLRELAAEAQSEDARIRIRFVAEELFRAKENGPSPAFLGIQHRASVHWEEDPRVPVGLYAMRVSKVYPGTAADKAGLQPGDLILEMNGVSATFRDSPTAMTDMIRVQRPGSECEFKIIRGGKGINLSRSENRSTPDGAVAASGFTPEGFKDAVVEVVTSEEEPRLADGTSALRLVTTQGLDPRLIPEVKAGDLIIGVDGLAFRAGTAKAQFEAWTQDRLDKDRVLAEWKLLDPMLPMHIQDGSQPKSLKRSIQIIRGGESMTLQTTLGLWPRYLKAALANARIRTEVRDNQVEDQFETWWSESKPKDEVILTPVDASLFWRMELEGYRR